MHDRQRILSREDISRVVALYRAGHTQSEIASMFGVTASAINYQLSKKLERPRDQRHCDTCTCYMRGV
jgi:transposase